jgi:hypothetical protein
VGGELTTRAAWMMPWFQSRSVSVASPG